MSAQMLEVSLLGIGTVLRLERDAWSMVKWLRRVTNEYAPPRVYVCMTHREPRSTVRAAGTAHTLLGTNYLEFVQGFVFFRGKSDKKEMSRNLFQ